MKTSKTTRSAPIYLAATITSLALYTGSADAAVYSVDVMVANGPNQFGSPSYASYLANAREALQTGQSSVGGDPATTPTAYSAFANNAFIHPGYAIASTFKSWIGTTNPGAAFDQEIGNRLKFGLHIMSDGALASQFNLSDVTYSLERGDPGNPGSGGFKALPGSIYDGQQQVGIDWGPDRIRGTADDIIYNSGESGISPTINLIDELIYTGIGTAYSPLELSPPDTEQEQLDNRVAYILNLGALPTTVTYNIVAGSGTDSGSGTVYYQIPEPSSVVLGLLGIGLFLHRRSR